MGQANEKRRTIFPLTDMADDGLGWELHNLKALTIAFAKPFEVVEGPAIPFERDQLSDIAWSFREHVNILYEKVKAVQDLYDREAKGQDEDVAAKVDKAVVARLLAITGKRDPLRALSFAQRLVDRERDKRQTRRSRGNGKVKHVEAAAT